MKSKGVEKGVDLILSSADEIRDAA